MCVSFQDTEKIPRLFIFFRLRWHPWDAADRLWAPGGVVCRSPRPRKPCHPLFLFWLQPPLPPLSLPLFSIPLPTGRWVVCLPPRWPVCPHGAPITQASDRRAVTDWQTVKSGPLEGDRTAGECVQQRVTEPRTTKSRHRASVWVSLPADSSV